MVSEKQEVGWYHGVHSSHIDQGSGQYGIFCYLGRAMQKCKSMNIVLARMVMFLHFYMAKQPHEQKESLEKAILRMGYCIGNKKL